VDEEDDDEEEEEAELEVGACLLLANS